MQVLGPPEPFDAVVVGSGATGGWAAKKLTEAGLHVALLEAGAKVTPRDFTEHVETWQMPYLGMDPTIKKRRPIQSTVYACRETNQHWFVDDFDNPYTQEKPFNWYRMRILGGRSLSWGRQSYRMSPLDLKAKSHDGYGDDWPISYEELVPHYEEVERYVGISGQPEGLKQLPDSVFQPPMPWTCGEAILRDAVKKKLNRTITMGRVAILTKAQNGRQACHYCGPCEQGCMTFSYFASPWTTVKDAMATGRCALITDAVAGHITMAGGKATGIAYIDAFTKQAKEVRAKIVVLCASTLESTRLLLNSKVADENAALGHHLMDHISGGGAYGIFPDLKTGPWIGPPRRANGIYVPRFLNIDQPRTDGLIRGYGYQGGSTPGFNMSAQGFGAKYKDTVRQSRWYVSLGCFAECLSRPENHVSIDSEKKDAWGIPVLKINMEWSENERGLLNHARHEAARMLEAAGVKNVQMTGHYSTPGEGIHEIGSARMGNDPKTSVFNSNCQSHEVPNLFCTDGSVWVSSGCQNPTLTMMAITVRACDFITKRYARNA